VLDVGPERDTGPGRRRLDPKRQGGQKRVRAQRRAAAGDVRLRLRPDDLLGFTNPCRAFDAYDDRLAEVGSDAVVALERRLDDFLLDLAVQRDGDLVAVLVLADVDERVLFGELGKGGPERPLLLGSAGEDHRFEAGSGEARRLLVAGRRLTDRVADPHGAETADRGHLPGREDVAARCPGRREDADRGRLRLLAAADANALPWPECAGEEADVGDALPRRRPLDLEDPTGDVAIRVAARPG
jgi:hypothetical protein